MRRPRRAGNAIGHVTGRVMGQVTGTAIAAALAVVLPLPLATSIAARAADAPAWRVVASYHYGASGNASGYSAVIAPAPGDAWVFGGTNPGAPGSPTAAHWGGRRWRHVALPAGLSGFIIAASASSPGNIWAVSYFGRYVLHWNGTRWAVAKRWHAGKATSVAAVSRSDVWVFGGGSSLGTWHYNGRTWAKITGRAHAVYRASALSRSDIWAVARRSRRAVEHYNGGGWRAVPTGSALARTTPYDILAVSPHSIWIAGVSAGGRLVLVHGNGAYWTRFVAPWQMRPERFASDGSGGIWIPAVTGAQTWITHLSWSGQWTRSAVDAGLGSGVGDLALIPGTTSLWASGGFLTKAGGDAAIWAYGPVTARMHAVAGSRLAKRRARTGADRRQ